MSAPGEGRAGPRSAGARTNPRITLPGGITPMSTLPDPPAELPARRPGASAAAADRSRPRGRRPGTVTWLAGALALIAVLALLVHLLVP